MGLRVRRVGEAVWSLAAAVMCALLLAGVARAGDLLIVQTLLVVVIVVMAARPIAGVIATAVLVPIAYAMLALTGAPIRPDALTDGLMIAALAGASLRGVAVSDATPSRLAGPARLLALIVAASAAVNIARAGADSPVTYLHALWTHVTGPYFFDNNKYVDVHEAVRWITGAALAVVFERTLRRAPAAAPVAVRLWLVGGAAAASFAWQRLADVALRREDPLSMLVYLFRTQRISALFPDVNAAGSYFALLFVPAVWLGVVRRRLGLLLIVAPVVLVALVVTQSRSALGAVAIVLCGAWILRDLRARRVVRAVAIVIVLAGTAYAGAAWTRGTHGSPGSALAIRGEMAKIALKMVREDPVFGTGIGRFRATSRAYVTNEFREYFSAVASGENAHNQFLQVLAELGVSGFVAFVVLGCGAVWHAARRPASTEHAAVGAGLVAFLISAAFGHPLLIPQVMALFFVALGLCAGLAAPPARPAWRGRLVGVLIAIIVGTGAWRVAMEFRPAPPAIVGAGEIAGTLDGVEFRRAEAVSSWLISPYARTIAMPMRWAAGGGSDCTVALRLDGRPADVVRLSADDWRPVRFPVPVVDGRLAEHRLELRVEPAACALLVGPIALTR